MAGWLGCLGWLDRLSGCLAGLSVLVGLAGGDMLASPCVSTRVDSHSLQEHTAQESRVSGRLFPWLAGLAELAGLSVWLAGLAGLAGLGLAGLVWLSVCLAGWLTGWVVCLAVKLGGWAGEAGWVVSLAGWAG